MHIGNRYTFKWFAFAVYWLHPCQQSISWKRSGVSTLPLKTTTKHFLNSNYKHISKITNLSLKPQTSIINRINFGFTTNQISLKYVQILHHEGDFYNVPLPESKQHSIVFITVLKCYISTYANSHGRWILYYDVGDSCSHFDDF